MTGFRSDRMNAVIKERGKQRMDAAVVIGTAAFHKSVSGIRRRARE